MTVTSYLAWIFTILFPLFSLLLVSIERIYQTPKTVFDRNSKHLKVRQKYSSARLFFNSLLGVWKWGQTRSFVFDYFLHQAATLGNKLFVI